MIKDQLIIKDIVPLFEIGQTVKLKGNDDITMVVLDYKHPTRFSGEFFCIFFERVKIYNQDGTAIEQTLKRTLPFDQDTLTLVSNNVEKISV